MFNVVKVYYSNIENKNCEKSTIQSLNPIRAEYVESIKDYGRKKQSLWVWKLLEFALIEVFGRCDFDFEYNGVFFAIVNQPEIKFSLSHSNNVVVVALSDNQVGVDLEMCTEKVLKLKNALKVDEKNFETDKDLIDALTLAWTKKESLYKAKSGKNYKYIKVNDIKFDYFITVCCDDDNVEFIKVDL